jgi:hypothetical protein
MAWAFSKGAAGLEAAFNQYLDAYQAPEAFELIEAAFRSAVRRRRGTLH